MTLQAQINPNEQETTYSFQYATSQAAVLKGEGTQLAGASPLPAGSGAQLASVEVSSLAPRTTYYYRALATNADGSSKGPVAQFTTTATPLVTTSPAQGMTRTTAMLLGTIEPGGEPTTYHFAYVTAADYLPGAVDPYLNGASTPESLSVGADFAVHPAGPATAAKLQPATTYHYALVATNPLGSVIGPDVAFTTAPATPPLSFTADASGVSQLSATLNGSVDTRGLPTVAQFEFGTVPGAGSLLPASTTPGAGASETLTADLEGDLQPGSTYYYRTVATNVDGTSLGEERSFTTATFPGQAPARAAPLIAWPGFVLGELAAGPPHQTPVTGPKPLTNRQKLARALKACAKKHGKRRAACRRAAKRRYR